MLDALNIVNTNRNEFSSNLIRKFNYAVVSFRRTRRRGSKVFPKCRPNWKMENKQQ